MKQLDNDGKINYLKENNWFVQGYDNLWVFGGEDYFFYESGISLDSAFESQMRKEREWKELGWNKNGEGVWVQNNILNKYPYGSRVYRSHTDTSDKDLIIISDKYYDSQDIDIKIYTVTDFQSALDNHEISALECYFLPFEMVYKKDHDFTFTLNKMKLRKSISTIASNSFVKGKKKLTILGDYDKELAIKSIFHALRILDFGIQIANNGKIVNYSSSNWILTDLKEMTLNLENNSAWEVVEHKYKKIFNDRASEVKMLCPKLNSNTLNNILTNIVKNYGVDKPGKLVAELETLFNTYDEHKGFDSLISEDKPIKPLIFKCTCFNSGSNCFSGMCDRCGFSKT